MFVNTISNHQSSTITIKRSHGLGNLVLLLPVLEAMVKESITINIVTRQVWCDLFRPMFSQFNWHSDTAHLALDIDLDAITEDQYPSEHRSDEFARILGCNQPILSPTLHVPSHWLPKKYAHTAGAIVFAPEGGHRSRQWPAEKCDLLKRCYPNDRLVLVGTQTETEIACDDDLRTQLSLSELLAVLAHAKVVLSMDSGILHLAAAIGVPTVAIFGGINPVYRVRKNQKVVVVQSALDCCPCNKKETCDDRFDCISTPSVEQIVHCIEIAQTVRHRTIYRVRESVLTV